jgi:hypothetical protein
MVLAPVKRLYFRLLIRLLQSTDLLLERPWSQWGNYRLLNSELCCSRFLCLFCFFVSFLFFGFNLI